jgi:hypothetical protein
MYSLSAKEAPAPQAGNVCGSEDPTKSPWYNIARKY